MLSAVMLKMAFPAWMDNLAWLDVQAKRQPESQNGYYLVSASNFRLLEASGIYNIILVGVSSRIAGGLTPLRRVDFLSFEKLEFAEMMLSKVLQFSKEQLLENSES